ncbi:MAG: hypothetical protein JOZ54_05265 [Acidobacteria bacterium]|nr:hypothetical protein [Acidobacteriota bacterium]
MPYPLTDALPQREGCRAVAVFLSVLLGIAVSQPSYVMRAAVDGAD